MYSKKLLLMIASQFGCSSILLSVCSIDLLMNFSTSSLLINDLFFEFGLFMLSTFSFKLTRLKSIEPYFRGYLIFPSFYALFDVSFLSLASSFFLSFLVFEIKSLKWSAMKSSFVFSKSYLRYMVANFLMPYYGNEGCSNIDGIVNW